MQQQEEEYCTWRFPTKVQDEIPGTTVLVLVATDSEADSDWACSAAVRKIKSLAFLPQPRSSRSACMLSFSALTETCHGGDLSHSAYYANGMAASPLTWLHYTKPILKEFTNETKKGGQLL